MYRNPLPIRFIRFLELEESIQDKPFFDNSMPLTSIRYPFFKR